NGTKDNLMVSTISATDPLTPGEGFFVKATGNGASITFNTQTRGEVKATEPDPELVEGVEVPTITLNLTQDGLLVDRFILKRDGEPLEKFSLNENATRIYATEGGKDYAVATVGRDAPWHVSTTDEIPVNFKAAQNGTYTLTFDTQNLDLDYLHLIDNLTGSDIDLLTPAGRPPFKGGRGDSNEPRQAEYTFEAKTTDYASRFRLVFSTPADEMSANRPFAFIADGEIRINEADALGVSLQVVDVMGRVVRCTDGACTVSTIGMAPGVYVLRLINGTDVRTQKIVIP
ncbi:MAG: T9SS type A sorting domain-containing protein, partial [Bacteroidales bacterium]|nr:T9SS type A sorting domain-containing protein [Bacteroidales bacterium]